MNVSINLYELYNKVSLWPFIGHVSQQNNVVLPNLIHHNSTRVFHPAVFHRLWKEPGMNRKNSESRGSLPDTVTGNP